MKANRLFETIEPSDSKSNKQSLHIGSVHRSGHI